MTIFTTITCQNTLTPGIKVTKVCPAQPVAPGQMLTFSGSVSNTGNVTLTNIVVVNDQPAPNTPVFTLASLAPGVSANFSGSYLAPTNCSVTDTLTATRGQCLRRGRHQFCQCDLPHSDDAANCGNGGLPSHTDLARRFAHL